MTNKENDLKKEAADEAQVEDAGETRRSPVFLRMKKLIEKIGLSRSTIYNKLNEKSPSYDPAFPKQRRIGLGAVGWDEAEVEAWMQQCVRKREDL
ncbi:helix-turn-helix transcriptional regulator [Modicisalibacter xianhensis]|uniref:Transcriptional regulator, AlpA family n=1 Tax=Modicisalibacter xianhensis TaxID=442341 RepID=A0A1I2ZL55_9GAMM|nr:AlpA family transcriptional regulator [Halomonas xianhensis]SFH38450.1 transcriptional regulator, AlpA family [Halomonas xianhensis]